VILGFTGTRRGLTDAQRQTLARLLAEYGSGRLHHGCCLGADAECAALLDGHHFYGEAHPSDMPSMTSRKALESALVKHPPKPPLERNRDIVAACELLIACPAETVEQQRSGTWATIRYARKVGRAVVLVWPDGSID